MRSHGLAVRECGGCREPTSPPCRKRAYLEREGASHLRLRPPRVALSWAPPMVVPSFGEETGLAGRGRGGRGGGGLSGPGAAGRLWSPAATDGPEPPRPQGATRRP